MAPRNSRVAPEVQSQSVARSFAQSLDSFYSPARDTRSEQALQRGIGAFSSIIGERAARAKQQQRQDEFDQGVADAIRESAGQELQGVKTGSIFRQHSSFYTQGLNEQRGKAAAMRWKNDLQTAYENWDGRFDDNPETFRAWMNEQSGRFIESVQGNPHMLASALPVVAEMSNNLALQHTNFTNERLQTEQFDAFTEVVGGMFDGFARGDLDEDGLIATLKAETDELYQMEGGIANDKLVEAAIMWSDTHDNMDAILSLAKAHDSGEIKLSRANQQKLERAADLLEAEIERQTRKRDADAAAEAAQVKQGAINGYLQQLLSGQNVDARDFYRENGFQDESIFRALVTAQNSFQTAGENVEMSGGETEFNFRSELTQADTFEDRLGVIRRYSRVLPRSVVAQEMQAVQEMANGNAYFESDFVKENRDNWLNGIGAVAEGMLSFDQLGEARVFAEGQYSRRMISRLRGVDASDVGALNQLHQEVSAEVNELLLNQYPSLRENAMQSETGGFDPNAEASGLADPIRQEQQTFLQQQQEEARRAGLMDGEDEAMAQPVEVSEETADAEPMPEEEETFYATLLNRFTDGQNTTARVFDATNIWKEDPEFASGMDRLGAKYGVNPGALMAIMDFETGGSFDPAVTNAAGSGATGLIQFMPSTAKALGTTTEELAQMTRAEQLVYVEKYFDQFADRIQGGDISDLYMAVLWPKAIGKPDSYVIFRQGTVAYRQNRGLDTNADGTVTKFEAAAKVRQRFYG